MIENNLLICNFNSDILKILFPLKKEPLTVEEMQEIIDHKNKEKKFWEKFKRP